MKNRQIKARWWPWLVFGLITAVLIAPLSMVYSWQSEGLKSLAVSQYLSRMNRQLDQWQDRLQILEWSALTDAADDVLHLDNSDQRALLAQTLSWRREGPDWSLYEGLALLDEQGRRGGASVTSAQDNMGRPLPREELKRLKAEKPWAQNPWLSDYTFVIKALAARPGAPYYVSGFINAPGRRVIVVGAARRNPKGELIGAVIAQLSVAEMMAALTRSAIGGRHLWLMDSAGNLGAATSALARASARNFKKEGGLTRLASADKIVLGPELTGSGGKKIQNLGEISSRLMYRTIGGRLILGAVETESTLGAWTFQAVRNMSVTAVTGLIALAVCAAIFTIIALRRESRLTELSTLGRTAGTMSHNVGNALTAIRGNLELISSGRVVDNAIIRERLAPAMETSLAGIEKILVQLRSLSRAGRIPEYDGQAGSNTLYCINSEDNHFESRSNYSHRGRPRRKTVNSHVA